MRAVKVKFAGCCVTEVVYNPRSAGVSDRTYPDDDLMLCDLSDGQTFQFSWNDVELWQPLS